MIKQHILSSNESIIHDVSKRCMEDWIRSSKDPRIGKSLIGHLGGITDSIFDTNYSEIYPIHLSARRISSGTQHKLHFKAILSNKDQITMVYKEILNNVCRDALIDKKSVILMTINDDKFKEDDLSNLGYRNLSDFSWIPNFYFSVWLPAQ